MGFKYFNDHFVKGNIDLGYRSNLGTYELTKDVVVPKGRALNNPSFGLGGYTQFYINGYSSVLKLIFEEALLN